jgi:uncharacterized protein (TIGR02466 family)
MHEMKALDVFKIPVYSFKFKDHDLYKDQWSDFLRDYRYKDKGAKRHFSITTPNLHKDELFNPLRVFMLECLYQVLKECGMHFDVGLTSMWGTQQSHGGFHHIHTHGNTLFAGVYYLKSEGGENPSGTIFQNALSDFMLIRMHKGHRSLPPKYSTAFHYDHTEPFEEGKMVIFPAWLRHTTQPNKGERRQILAFNSMPIGKTANDFHDRYIYQDFRNQSMYGDEEL